MYKRVDYYVTTLCDMHFFGVFRYILSLHFYFRFTCFSLWYLHKINLSPNSFKDSGAAAFPLSYADRHIVIFRCTKFH